MDIDAGIRVSGLTAAITPKDLKVYFSNPRNGGGKISKLYHPLKDNDAVIFFDGTSVTDLVTRRHVIKGQTLGVKRTKKMFSKVTVEVEGTIRHHLDENSTYLDDLQFDGELEVNFDDDLMTYTMTGDWYQVEWAWNYLDKTLETPGDAGQIPEQTIPDSGGTVSDICEGGHLEDTLQKKEATFDSNIKWNITAEDPELRKFISTPARSNISMPIVRHVTSGGVDKVTLEETVKKTSPYANNLDQPHNEEVTRGRTRSPPVSHSTLHDSDSKDFLLGNPLKGLTGHHRDPYEYYSDDTDDELEAVISGSSPPSPPVSIHRPFVPYPRRRVPSPKGIEILHSDFGDMPLTFDTVIKNMEITLLMGDILKEKNDAIVNPANKDLSHTYGISHSIARLAGRNLQEECRNYIQRHGQLVMADVMHTCAGGALNERVGFVLHTVPPSWREDESESTAHILTCTYLNCLQYANKQLWLRSLSVPLIGAGGMGIPLDVSVQSFYDAVLLHKSEEKQTNHLQTVNLVSNSQDSTCAMIVVMRSLMDLDEDECQKAAIERYITKKEKFSFRAKEFWLDEKEKEDDTTEKEENTDADKTTDSANIMQTADKNADVDDTEAELAPTETSKTQTSVITTETDSKGEEARDDAILDSWNETHFAIAEPKVNDNQEDTESKTQTVTSIPSPDKFDQSPDGESVPDLSFKMNGGDAMDGDCGADDEGPLLNTKAQMDDCQALDAKDTDALLDHCKSDTDSI